ncbi:hypothetical protein [Mesorhizobium sp. CN2-181]|uniref:hypothetical protein n=1 Tax=Mesorhizobium yinganensis TaxID=3157707 RepID=UPI0032B84DED
MDLQNLVAAHLSNRFRPVKMDAAAEDRYFRDQAMLSHPRFLRLLLPITAVAGIILPLVGSVLA